MPCTTYGNATVCTTGVREIRRAVRHCPICQRRRRFVVVYGWSPYYSPTTTCLGCGDSWQEGELGYRPFQRGWRDKAKAKAREQWANAFEQTREQREAWRREWFPPQRPKVVDLDTGGRT